MQVRKSLFVFPKFFGHDQGLLFILYLQNGSFRENPGPSGPAANKTRE
ncbi:MAG TPA: hypothetical protein HA306_00695 [Methanosarcina sp.]|nr:hypothetical protein [Methanosarcina sp.]